jgi:hypothetical protein
VVTCSITAGENCHLFFTLFLTRSYDFAQEVKECFYMASCKSGQFHCSCRSVRVITLLLLSVTEILRILQRPPIVSILLP